MELELALVACVLSYSYVQFEFQGRAIKGLVVEKACGTAIKQDFVERCTRDFVVLPVRIGYVQAITVLLMSKHKETLTTTLKLLILYYLLN